MQNVNTSVLARRVRISDSYTTHPYEAGWASEALVFVQTEGEHPELSIAVEVSPDGLHWVPRSGGATIPSNGEIAEIPVAHFGNWLRVRIEGADAGAPARVLVHAVMKG